MRRCCAFVCLAATPLALACGGGDSTSPSASSATGLAIGHAASHALVGHTLDTIKVEIHDAQGALFAAKPVTVSLGFRSTSGSTTNASGPSVAVSVGGVARFVGVSIPALGQYVMSFSAPDLPTVSQQISVDPEPVVIDSTALRLVSDSTSIANGVYSFTGAGTASVDSGRVIVGAQGAGFLRRVTHVDRAGNTVTAQTVPAALNEIIQNDSFVVRIGSASSSVSPRAARVGSYRVRFVPATPSAARSSNETFAITNLVLASASGGQGLVVSSASFSVLPAFEFVVHLGDLFEPVQSAHVAMSVTVAFQAATTLGLSTSLDKSGSVPLGNLEYFILASGIPVFFELPITLEWSLSASGNLDLSFGWSSSATTSVGANWTRSTGWQPAESATFSFTPQFPTPQVDAAATVHLGAQVKPRIVVAGVAGGDIYVQPFVEGNANVNLVTNSWSTSCRSAVALGLDLDLTIVDLTLASYTTATELASSVWPVCAYSGTILPSITVTPSTLQMIVGDKVVVVATVSNSADKSVTWTSSSPSVASVDATGLVTALTSGTTQIIAHHASGARGSSAVAVSPPPSPGAIVILSITTASGALADLTHLRGQILVTVGANPGGHVLKEVDLTVDGQVVARQLVSSSSSVSYTLGFDTTKISDGTHRLQAVMVDTDGTLTATNAVTVTIVN